MNKILNKVTKIALSIAMLVTVGNFGLNTVNAISQSGKPTNASTSTQPFETGTGGSENFRIPGLVSLDDGTIIASADARWNTDKDGGGLDIIVSSSKDNGSTWNYTFPHYFGDNGNTYNRYSTTFMDSALATDGKTVYLLSDMFPAGYALNANDFTEYDFTDTEVAFDSNGRLLLQKTGESGYNYYLDNGYIYTTAGVQVEGYSVDEWFDLAYNGVEESNLFYEDATFQTRKTSFICLTSSTDGGTTWSAPKLLNLKNQGMAHLIVGPGRGLVTSDGTLMFTAYEAGKSAHIIYSKDGGNTWNKATTTAATNESQLVELNDGTIRMVAKNSKNKICYVDFVKNGTGYSTDNKLVTTTVTNCSACMISAIKYSKTIDGKEAILVSCPSSEGTRFNGKIHVFTLDDNNAMTLLNSYEINKSKEFFAYSCMTELPDGSISILYEDDCAEYSYGIFNKYTGENAHITYKNLPISTITSYPIGGDGMYESGNSELVSNITLNINTNNTKTISLSGLSDTQAITASGYNEEVVNVTIDGANATFTSVGAGTTTVTFTVQSNSRAVSVGDTFDVTVTVIDETLIAAESMILGVGEEKTYTIDGLIGEEGDHTTADGVSEYTIKHTSVTGEREVWKLVENGSAGIVSNGEYLIVNTATDGQAYALTSSGTSSIVNITNKVITTASTDSVFKLIANGSGYSIQDSSGTYLYPSASHRVISGWSYSLSNSQSSAQAVSINGNYTVTLSRNISERDVIITHNTTSYINYGTSYGASDSASNLYLFKKTTVDTEEHTTTVTFKGSKVGTTSVDLSGYVYNVSVVNTGNGMIAGSNEYKDINGTGKDLEKLTLSVGVPFDVDIKDTLPTGGNVVWSTENRSVATVDESTGSVTGVSAGNTTLIATTYDANGNVHSINKIPLQIIQGSGSNSGYLVSVYVDEIVNSEVYYSLHASGLIQASEHEMIYIKRSNAEFGLVFFAKPVEGYALSSIVDNGDDAKREYFPLHTGDYKTTSDGTSETYFAESDVYGYLSSNAGISDANRTAMLNEALAKKCDAGLGYTRKWNIDSSKINLGADLSFYSSKLLSLEKEVSGIISNGETIPYTEGMTAKDGDIVEFDVTVTVYASNDTITYTNVTLKEILEGAVFKDNSSKTYTIADSYVAPASTTDQKFTYKVQYKVQSDDLDTLIKNEVELTYNYKSEYSQGSMSAAANAEAKITATSYEAHVYVADFGLPMTFSVGAFGKEDIVSAEAKYGHVSFTGNHTSGYTVTYTPTSVLHDEEVIVLSTASGAEYPVYIVPATSVYYEFEEPFVDLGNAWGSVVGTIPNNKPSTQSADSENTENVYGYDDYYNGNTENSDYRASVSSTNKDYVKFTFTGTGLDIYNYTSKDTGNMMVYLYDSNNMIKKISVINTKNTYLANTGSYYNTPVYSVHGLSHGKYTIMLTPVNSSTTSVYADGFRVYNTLADKNNEVYVAHNEAANEYAEFRDIAIAGVINGTVSVDDIDDLYELSGNIVSTVYNATNNTSGAIILENNELENDETTTLTVDADMINNGPKNEIYLKPGQAIALNVNGYASLNKIVAGIRSLNGGEIAYTVNGVYKTVNSTVDMYYDVTDEVMNNNGKLVICNPSNSTRVLALTKLRVSVGNDSTGAASVSYMIDEDTVGFALMCMRVYEPTLANATANITLNDENGNVVARTTLPVEGIEGDTTVVEAASILEAVKEILPSGYEIVNAEEITDVEIVYGESADVEVIVKLVKTETDTEVKAPETGDSTNVGLWISMMLLALGALVFARRKAN